MAKLELGREKQLPKHWTGTASRRTRRRDRGRGRRKVAPPTHSWSLSPSGFSKFTDLKRLVKYRWSNMMGIEGGDRRQRYVGRVGQAGTVSNHMTTRFSYFKCLSFFFPSHSASKKEYVELTAVALPTESFTQPWDVISFCPSPEIFTASIAQGKQVSCGPHCCKQVGSRLFIL